MPIHAEQVSVTLDLICAVQQLRYLFEYQA